MKKFLSVLLMSVLLVTTLAVFAMADPEPTGEPDPAKYDISIGVDSDIPAENRNEDRIMGTIKVYDVDAEKYSSSVDETGTPGGYDEVGKVAADNTVSMVCEAEPGYKVGSVTAYWQSYDVPEGENNKTGIEVRTNAEPNTWTFTMVPHQVFVDIRFELRRPPASPAKTPASNQGGDAELNSTAAPHSDSTYIPPSPAYNSNEVEEPQRASAVPAEAPKSVLPANTVTFGSGSALASTGAAYNRLNNLTKNNAEKFSATVLSLEAPDLSNQNGLAAYYAAIEGKEANILATYGVYASRELSAEDNGKLKSLTWKNITAEKLDKKTRIKAVCYNLIDGTYTIEGEVDEFGNVILKNFIIRPGQTNITVFICK